MISKKKSVIRIGLVLWLALAGMACKSDDESGGTSGEGGSAGTENSGGTGGTAGDDAGTAGTTGGMGGAGGTSGGAGGTTGGTGGTAGVGTPPAPLMCGDKTCTVNSLALMFGIVACCTTDNECGGFGGMCHALAQEGEIGEACPSGSSTDGQYPLPGCCKPDGRCGLDYGAVGWGCVAREEITVYMASEVPLEAVSCGGGSDEDAGL